MMPCAAIASTLLSPPRKATSSKLASGTLRLVRPASFDQLLRMRHMFGIKIISLAGQMWVGGREQTQPKALPKAELECALRSQRPARRAHDAQCGKCQVAGRGLGVEIGRVSFVWPWLSSFESPAHPVKSLTSTCPTPGAHSKQMSTR